MEVEGRKDARKKQKKEEEEEMSRRKRPMRRKRKVNNITEIESKPDSCQILEKVESSSFKLLGEGAILESIGSKENVNFMDGTRADRNRQFSTVAKTLLDNDVKD